MALQKAVRVLGCKGGDFATLLKSAKSSVLKGYDIKDVIAIENLVGWVSAARSEKSDSHKVLESTKDDIWFVIHMVGILILRLSKHESFVTPTTSGNV